MVRFMGRSMNMAKAFFGVPFVENKGEIP